MTKREKEREAFLAAAHEAISAFGVTMIKSSELIDNDYISVLNRPKESGLDSDKPSVSVPYHVISLPDVNTLKELTGISDDKFMDGTLKSRVPAVRNLRDKMLSKSILDTDCIEENLACDVMQTYLYGDSGLVAANKDILNAIYLDTPLVCFGDKNTELVVEAGDILQLGHSEQPTTYTYKKLTLKKNARIQFIGNVDLDIETLIKEGSSVDADIADFTSRGGDGGDGTEGTKANSGTNGNPRSSGTDGGKGGRGGDGGDGGSMIIYTKREYIQRIQICNDPNYGKGGKGGIAGNPGNAGDGGSGAGSGPSGNPGGAGGGGNGGNGGNAGKAGTLLIEDIK